MLWQQVHGHAALALCVCAQQCFKQPSHAALRLLQTQLFRNNEASSQRQDDSNLPASSPRTSPFNLSSLRSAYQNCAPPKALLLRDASARWGRWGTKLGIVQEGSVKELQSPELPQEASAHGRSPAG